jgi:hypothetical protein
MRRLVVNLKHDTLRLWVARGDALGEGRGDNVLRALLDAEEILGPRPVDTEPGGDVRTGHTATLIASEYLIKNPDG